MIQRKVQQEMEDAAMTEMTTAVSHTPTPATTTPSFVINLVDLPHCDQNSAAVPSTQSIILNDIPAPPPLAENSDAVTEIKGLVAAAAGSTSTTTTKLPPNLSKSNVLYSEFMNLLNADEHFSKVDVTGGGWVWCCLCNMEVASRSGRPFTLVRLSEHKSNKSHCMKMKSADLKRKPECDLDRFEQSSQKQEEDSVWFGIILLWKEEEFSNRHV
jgi:hypothetical protein